MSGVIKLRFVTEGDMLSAMIRLQAGLCIPFTPSHVEAVSLDERSWIGQHLDGGMMARPVGYDDAKLMALPDGSKSERFVDLPCTEEQQDGFYDYVESKIGQPYDWSCIFNFVDPLLNLHEFNHLICSAVMVAGIRSPKCQLWRWPLTVPFHRISPRDLFLMASSQVEIPHTGENQ